MKKFDYIVIGAGSGGIASARRAAKFGKKVAIIENRVVGGTCVNVGCVPKKVMFNLASFLEDAQYMKHYGVNGLEPTLDFAQLKNARDAYVKRLNGIYMRNLGNDGISYFQGLAKFADQNVVLAGEEKLTADHILIASGSAPRHIPFPGDEYCMDSNDFFAMEQLPKSIAVIGGGYIAVELAQILNTLGVQTSIIARSQLLNFVDRDVIDVLGKEIENSGIKLHL